MSLIPSTQLELFIHGNELNNFVSLYKRNKLPNRILLKGRKGIGKCTLAYHLINFILSEKEDFAYNTDSLKIDERNKSYKLILNGSSPNFFLIDIKSDKKYIDISQIRSLIKNLNTSSLNNKPRFIIFDNSEYLNKNSINALLREIEAPKNKVYFILIQDHTRLLPTLTSRFVKFDISLTNSDSNFVINKLLKDDVSEYINRNLINYYFSPGNIYKLINFSIENDIDLKDLELKELIVLLIEKNFLKKDTDLRYIFQELIEFLLKEKTTNLDIDYYNYFTKKFNEVNKFNLDTDPLLIELNEKVLNG